MLNEINQVEDQKQEEHITERRKFNQISDRDLKEIASYIREEVPAANAAQTFTISQVSAAMFAILTIVGSLVSTWVSLNSQITTLKVSTDLIFSQISRDQATANLMTIEFRNRVDETLKELSNKMDVIDSSISQLYISNSNSKKSK